MGTVGKKQVLPVGEGEFHTLQPGAFRQALWDPRLGTGPGQRWRAHLQPEPDRFPTPCLGFPARHGRGCSPCSGLKGVLVVPKVAVTSCEGALNPEQCAHSAWKALLRACMYSHVPDTPRRSGGRGGCSPHQRWFLESVSPQASGSIPPSPRVSQTKPTYRNKASQVRCGTWLTYSDRYFLEQLVSIRGN